MARIDIRELTVTLGDRQVLDRLTLTISDGEALVVAGPSGAGKTTLLRAIAGLQDPSAGDILFDGVSVIGVPTRERDVAFISSGESLYRHLDVEGNLRFPLERRGMAPEQRAQRVQATARVLRLTGLLRRRPSQLSGGEQRRVSLGRATGRRPRAFLFDEPLAHLEPAERERLTDDLRTVQSGMGVTAVIVTHDQRELMTLAPRLAILDAGRLVQIGPPLVVYDRPATTTVATLVGEPGMALVRGDVDAERGTITLAGTAIVVPDPIRGLLATAPRTVLVGIRPEHVHLAAAASPPILSLRVHATASTGARRTITGDLGHRPASRITLTVPSTLKVAIGDDVPVTISVERLRLFDAATGVAIE